MESYFFNKEVVVDAVYFEGDERLTSYPKHMVFDGQEVTFRAGRSKAKQHAERPIRLYDMTDGARNYRLLFEPLERTWKLLKIASHEQVAA